MMSVNAIWETRLRRGCLKGHASCRAGFYKESVRESTDLGKFASFDTLKGHSLCSMLSTHRKHGKERQENRSSDREERELVARAKAGDGQAFRKLVRMLEQTVFQYAFKVCRDRESAEETLQDTFINMYRKLEQFDGRSKLTTWLYSIVTNHCRMKRRRTRLNRATIPLEEMTAEQTVDTEVHLTPLRLSPIEHVMNRELREALDEAIEKLPLPYRLVFVLRDLEGLTAAETAKVLKISEEAAKSRLRRARARLRENLYRFVTP